MPQVHSLFDTARLLHNLQRVNEVSQTLSGLLDTDAIAARVTDALVERFDCVFARIWLLEPDQVSLRLVASSGLYTHLDGDFARVPMGAYKVGKIAQNRVPFLSNRLPEEPWVKDRQWALANKIQGFAGYPLMAGNRVLGVLAAFSQSPFAPEFLEVLQILCMTLTVALDAAHEHHVTTLSVSRGGDRGVFLSDQIARILGETQFMLVGTELPLPTSLTYLFLRAAEILRDLDCSYCRLRYLADEVTLEAIATMSPPDVEQQTTAAVSSTPPAKTTMEMGFTDLAFLATGLGGTLEMQPVMEESVYQIILTLAPGKQAAHADFGASKLSEREQQIMRLLVEGKRDRSIAEELFISESTVKFHINNSLTKLEAKNRYQGVYRAAIRGWI